MKDKKGISAIAATVLIILITVAAVTIIWAAIIPMIKIPSINIYLNDTQVYNITYKTVNSIEMIESGRYPDYLFCYSYCIDLGISYNSTEITKNCNMKCIQELGVDDVIYHPKEEWLNKNCIATELYSSEKESMCNQKYTDCDGFDYDKVLEYQCGNYNIEVKGRN